MITFQTLAKLKQVFKLAICKSFVVRFVIIHLPFLFVCSRDVGLQFFQFCYFENKVKLYINIVICMYQNKDRSVIFVEIWKCTEKHGSNN